MAGELAKKLKELQKLIIERNNKEFKACAVELLSPSHVDEAEAPVDDATGIAEIEDVEILIRKSIAEEQEAIATYIKRARKCEEQGRVPLAKLFRELATDEIVHASSLMTALDMFGLMDFNLEVQGHNEAIDVMLKEGVNEDTDYEKKAAALEQAAEKERKEFDFVAEYTRNKADYDREKVVDAVNNLILGKSSLDDMMDHVRKECTKSSKKDDKKSDKKDKKQEKKDKK